MIADFLHEVKGLQMRKSVECRPPQNDHGRRTDCAVWSRCVLAEDLREDFDGVGVLKRLECACISREVLDGFQHDDEEH